MATTERIVLDGPRKAEFGKLSARVLDRHGRGLIFEASLCGHNRHVRSIRSQSQPIMATPERDVLRQSEKTRTHRVGIRRMSRARVRAPVPRRSCRSMALPQLPWRGAHGLRFARHRARRQAVCRTVTTTPSVAPRVWVLGNRRRRIQQWRPPSPGINCRSRDFRKVSRTYDILAQGCGQLRLLCTGKGPLLSSGERRGRSFGDAHTSR
jgi:hypothetical protein